MEIPSPEILGIIISAAGGLLAFSIKAAKKIRGIFSKVHAHFAKFDQMTTDVGFLVKEVKPNGGSSLRDAVSRIEKRQDEMDGRQAIMEARQVSVMDMSERPQFEIGKDGRCIFTNISFQYLVGKGPEDLLGHNWKNCIHPDDKEKVTEEWRAAVSEDTDFQSRYRIVTTDEEVFNVTMHARRMKRGGNTLGWSGNITHIEKTAEESS